MSMIWHIMNMNIIKVVVVVAQLVVSRDNLVTLPGLLCHWFCPHPPTWPSVNSFLVTFTTAITGIMPQFNVRASDDYAVRLFCQ